jgi:integrase
MGQMRGTLVRRSKGSWSIKLELGKDPKTGKRTQKWITVRGNKKEAEVQLARHVNDLNTGGFVSPAKLTVAEYLDKWLAHAVTKVSRKTYERYESIIMHHLKPALGALKLPQLAPLHIQDHYTRALSEGRKDGRDGGLSPQTVLHHHRVLSEALTQAVGWQLLARNPAAAVEPPTAEAKEAKVIDESQSADLLDAAQGTRLYIPIMMALALGARRGEILAVRWSDFNPFKATLNINRSLEETKAGGVQFKTTKVNAAVPSLCQLFWWKLSRRTAQPRRRSKPQSSRIISATI